MSLTVKAPGWYCLHTVAIQRMHGFKSELCLHSSDMLTWN